MDNNIENMKLEVLNKYSKSIKETADHWFEPKTRAKTVKQSFDEVRHLICKGTSQNSRTSEYSVTLYGEDLEKLNKMIEVLGFLIDRE